MKVRVKFQRVQDCSLERRMKAIQRGLIPGITPILLGIYASPTERRLYCEDLQVAVHNHMPFNKIYHPQNAL